MPAAQATPMPTQCPRCGTLLEAGFLLAPRGIYWDKRTHWSILGSEALLSMCASLTMPSVPASRCMSCALVVFNSPSAVDARGISRPAGFRYACPGCGGDVYADQSVCPGCGRPLPLSESSGR